MDLAKYSRYIGHDPHINKTFPKFMRPANRRISKLLEGIDFTQPPSKHDPHLSRYERINGRNFLINFLKEHDNAQIYLCEANAKTVPTKKFLLDFSNFCLKNLPTELLCAKFDQVYHDGDNEVITQSIQQVDADQKISSIVRLALPTYANNVTYANKLYAEFQEIGFNDGYFLTYSDVVHCQYNVGTLSQQLCI